jgi:predicted AlkP superfamily phosphohydrolase/phosphomutase/tetratricopeptide (TPR) repeat protein
MSKLLFIGWDGADWQLISPLLNSGRMPNLARLMQNGCFGNIKTLDPPLSPVLWTSIATGKRAYDHGITHFFKPDHENKKMIPVSNSDRKVKAIWEILSQADKWCNVVAWWPSFPADQINGCMVSDVFFNSEKSPENGEPQSFKHGHVFPDVHQEILRALLVSEDEISNAFIQELLPSYDPEKFGDSRYIQSLRRILAHMISVHRVSLWLMQFRPWDFHAVYFETIDRCCHMFIQFAPPHRDKINLELYELFKDLVDAIYIWHDRMLGDYMSVVGDQCTIMLASDHGFKSGKDRMKAMPKGFANAAMMHRINGVFVLGGEGINHGNEIFGLNLLDICPTILYHMDVPVARDMPGRVIKEMFKKQAPVEWIDGYEDIQSPRTIQHVAYSDEIGRFALQQMEELGYIEVSSDFERDVNANKAQHIFNYSCSLIEGGKHDEAYVHLTNLVSSYPSETKYQFALFNLSLSLGKFDIAEGVIDMIDLSAKGWFNIKGLRGDLNFYRGKGKIAEAMYDEALMTDPTNAHVLLMKGRSLLQNRNLIDAQKYFVRALAANEENGYAYYLLALTSFRLGQYSTAIGYCQEALAKGFSTASAQLLLGRSAFFAEEYSVASTAFEYYLQLFPENQMVRKKLVEIYRDKTPDKEKYGQHFADMNNLKLEDIIVVTGLPRSGTSMMMQMLDMAQIPILTDGNRKPDVNNPKGYFEFEKVKRMAVDVSWLKDATGKAVKIVAPLLQHLPPHFTYKVIYMHRNIDEIIASQQKLIESEKGVHSGKSYNLILAESYRKLEESILGKQWLNGSSLLKLDYSELVNGQLEELEKLEDFLGIELDISKMASVADPALYRNKLI